MAGLGRPIVDGIDAADAGRDEPSAHDPTSLRSSTGYMPIENYGLIGNMHTCALVATDGSIDFMCWPDFDSPSVFCRLLDKSKGGYFFIGPKKGEHLTTKQQYLPSSNILQTRYLGEEGVLNLIDFFPRPVKASSPQAATLETPRRQSPSSGPEESLLKKWLVRRVECIRGKVEVEIEVFPVRNAD